VMGETNPYRIRDDEIYRRRMRGESIADLAREFNVGESRISAIVTEVSRSLPERDRSELIALSIERLDFLTEKVMTLAEMEGAPIFVGKDGILARDENEEIVRDFSLRIKAIAEAHRLNQTFAKRLGLDAPTQSEVNASVQYEIVGVDPEELK
jgi:hypothetical protein